MTPLGRRRLAIASIGIAGILLHLLSTRAGVSYIPAVILISTVLTFCLASPGVYLSGLAVIAELYSTLPPGVALVVVAIPSLTRRLVGAGAGKRTFPLLVTLAATVTAQLSAQLAADLLLLLPAQKDSPLHVVTLIPAMYALAAVGSTTLAAFLLCRAYQEFFPPPASHEPLSTRIR